MYTFGSMWGYGYLPVSYAAIAGERAGQRYPVTPLIDRIVGPVSHVSQMSVLRSSLLVPTHGSTNVSRLSCICSLHLSIPV